VSNPKLRVRSGRTFLTEKPRQKNRTRGKPQRGGKTRGLSEEGGGVFDGEKLAVVRRGAVKKPGPKKTEKREKTKAAGEKKIPKRTTATWTGKTSTELNLRVTPKGPLPWRKNSS